MEIWKCLKFLPIIGGIKPPLLCFTGGTAFHITNMGKNIGEQFLEKFPWDINCLKSC